MSMAREIAAARINGVSGTDSSPIVRSGKRELQRVEAAVTRKELEEAVTEITSQITVANDALVEKIESMFATQTSVIKATPSIADLSFAQTSRAGEMNSSAEQKSSTPRTAYCGYGPHQRSGRKESVRSMERKEKQGYVSDVKKGAKKSKRRSHFFKDSEFTPLNDTIENIFRATKGTIAYPVPERMQVKDAAMKSGKFCQFHDQPGHSTNECRHLRSLVERLVRENYLQHYVQRHRPAYMPAWESKLPKERA